MADEGVAFEPNVLVGEDVSVRYLRRTFDVVLLTIGAGPSARPAGAGRELDGIHFAMDYLTQSNRAVSGEEIQEKRIFAKDKTVLVIGGGDTGSDCVGTAHRQGAKKVYQFEILPKPAVWEKPWNPSLAAVAEYSADVKFPRRGVRAGVVDPYRRLFRSRRDGQARASSPASIGKRTKNRPPENGRDCGKRIFARVDLVLLALGFVHVEHNRLTDELGIEFDERGNIKFRSDYSTSVPDVFVAGDAGTGASLVVRAIQHGRDAAEAIDRSLKG